MGQVQAIIRYPVKSMVGEAVASAPVEADGIVGDRGWAVHDLQTGLVASAKHPRRFAALLSCSATLGQDRIPLVSVQGQPALRAGDPVLDERLSDLTGRHVQLRRGTAAGSTLARTDPPPDGDVSALKPATTNPLAAGTPGDAKLVDYAPIHLITASSLAELDAARFRPNLVLDVEGDRFAENSWSGCIVEIGDVQLAVEQPTPRCVVPSLPQAHLPASRGLLRQLAQANELRLGAYATVTRPGEFNIGAPVRIRRA